MEASKAGYGSKIRKPRLERTSQKNGCFNVRVVERMAEKVRGWIIAPTGLFIRDYLLKHKRGYGQEIWRSLKAERAERGIITGSYQSFRVNYIYVLKKLGLIEPVKRERVHPKMFARTYYSIIPGREDDPAWRHPQIALDPRRGGPPYRRTYARKRKVRLLPKPPSPEMLDRIWRAASAFLRERDYVLTREQFEAVRPEWTSEVGLYPTCEERVGYVVRRAAEIEYVSRMARRLITPEEAPEPFATEARKLGKTFEREWLRPW